MRLEFSTSYRRHLALEDAIFECFMIGFNNFHIGGHPKADIQKVKQLKKDLELKFSLHAPFPKGRREVIPFEKLGEIICKSIDVANELEADPVVFHAAIPKNFEKNKELFLNEIGKIVDYAKTHGITVCVENLYGENKFPKTAEDMLWMVKNVKNLKLCFDTEHAYLVEKTEEGAINFLKKIAKFVRCVHLVNIEPELDSLAPPSTINRAFFGKIMDILHEVRYKGPIVIEAYPDIPEQEIINGMNFVRCLMIEKYFAIKSMK